MIERSILILTVLSALSLFAHGFDHPRVHCQTTKGPLTIEVYRDWSPLGADRFLELVKDDFYTNISFFRCVKRFLTQFGISDNPTKKHWHRKEIQDDPNLHLGIKKNYVSYAGGGPNSRNTQLFIAFEDLDFLGNEPWETPFGQVIEGQETLDVLYKGYGDIPPFGKGPDQQKIYSQGNSYVHDLFPKIDFIESCHMIDPKDEDIQKSVDLDQQKENEIEEERVHKKEQKEVQEGKLPLPVADRGDGMLHAEGNDNDAIQQPMGGIQVDRLDSELHEKLRSNSIKNDLQPLLDRNTIAVKYKHREQELIIKAILFLILSFTILFIFMRHNSIGIIGKKQ